ncbi:MAG: haloacid dehalogenase-like hydrolase [Streptosporangiaceae bacterium]|nr:haloacid dehalogenase-like hydrolase [Streptosporangiaceae bacterium]
MAKRLVLWDIDHTLIDTRGVGRELSAEAFERVTGVTMRTQAKIDGITEQVIFRETARLHGLSTDREDFGRFAEALAHAHLVRSAELRERGHALPGAASALDALAAIPGMVQTVVTGNVRRVAEIKVETFGLDRHIDFGIGAYGEDSETRAELVRTAIERARAEVDADLDAGSAVIFGDTPADVEAGRDSGVFVVGVATGRTTVQELKDAGADCVLADLKDTSAVVGLVRDLASERCG